MESFDVMSAILRASSPASRGRRIVYAFRRSQLRAGFPETSLGALQREVERDRETERDIFF